MSTGHIIQNATVFSLLIAGLGLAVAVLTHREQVKTQIFLALSAQYDELQQSSSPGVWLSIPPGAVLPERSDDLSISALRFSILLSLTIRFISRAQHTQANVAVDAAVGRATAAQSFVRA